MSERPCPLIDFKHVSVSRGNRTVLHDISLKIQTGKHVAILGPNGCGKTTLIKTIMRECYPIVKDGSSLTILGQEQWNIFELRSTLGIGSNDLMIDYIGEFSGREVVIKEACVIYVEISLSHTVYFENKYNKEVEINETQWKDSYNYWRRRGYW